MTIELNLESAQTNLAKRLEEELGFPVRAIIETRDDGCPTLNEIDVSVSMKPRVFKTLKITAHGGCFYDEECTRFSFRLKWRWSSFGGGSNGTDYAFVQFNANGDIALFQTEEEYYAK